MQFYGDKICEIKGSVSKYDDDDFLLIHFSESNRSAYVPKYLIKHRIKTQSSDIQVFYLPEWFLKRNRVIPL